MLSRTLTCIFIATLIVNISIYSPLVSALSALPASTQQPNLPNAGLVTGTVFWDVNGNGLREANELGMDSITVSAFSAAQFSSTTTDASGAYTLTVSAAQVRLEFTNYPLGFDTTFFGPSSGTSVQFISPPASAVNFGLFRAKDYCTTHLRVCVTQFSFGDSVNGPDRDRATIITLPYTATGIQPDLQQPEALAKQVGATYGLAYQRVTHTLFAAAYVKRAASFGPGTGQPLSDGTGVIYRVPIDGTPADATPFFDLDVLLGRDTTGANPHTDLDPDAPDFDSGGFDAVGKIAFGDLEMGEDEQTLWTVNLHERTLVRIPIGFGPTPPLASDVVQYPMPAPNCVRGVGRPFGLGMRNGMMYVGGVCTAEQNGTAADLKAYVYAFNPNTQTWSSQPVLQFDLDYPRGCADLHLSYPTQCHGTQGALALWNPWVASMPENFPAGFYRGFVAHPQPMLSDIEFFSGNGLAGKDDQMVLAFRDRFGDQVGYLDPGPFGTFYRNPFNPLDHNVYDLKMSPAGDILRASLNSMGTWALEQNSAGIGFGPSNGQNTGEGPSTGEFYWGDRSIVGKKLAHDESSVGALAQVPGRNEMVASVADPIRSFSGGLAWLSHDTGGRLSEYEVYPPEAEFSFRKANGLGDVEVLCEAAPIEIGNVVWFDGDKDGIKDAEEPPIAGVVMQLTDVLGRFVTTTTEFVAGPPGWVNHTYDFAFVVPSTATPTSTPTPTATPTQISIFTPTPTATPTQISTPTPTPTAAPTSTPTSTQTSTQAPSQTNTPTATSTSTPTPLTQTPTQTPTPTEAATAVATLVVPQSATTAPPQGPALILRKSAYSARGPSLVGPGELLTYTLMLTNTGDMTATQVYISDTLPTGTDYVAGSARPALFSGPSPLVWFIGTVGPGQTVPVQFTVRVKQNSTAASISNFAAAGSTELPPVTSNTVVNTFLQTAVALTRFEVRPDPRGLKLIWETGTELNTFGYVLYRANRNTFAEATLLTAEIVAAHGPGQYLFVDTSATSTQPYVYWLQEIERDGQTHTFGPLTWQNAPTQPMPAVAAGGVPVAVIDEQNLSAYNPTPQPHPATTASAGQQPGAVVQQQASPNEAAATPMAAPQAIPSAQLIPTALQMQPPAATALAAPANVHRTQTARLLPGTPTAPPLQVAPVNALHIQQSQPAINPRVPVKPFDNWRTSLLLFAAASFVFAGAACALGRKR